MQDNKILINKSIDKIEEDVIGIKGYVECIDNAIDQGAKKIAISSQYGSGKTSICNILSKKMKYKNVSKINLWNMIPKGSYDTNENNLSGFYKSFLYQLAASYCGKNMAKYVNKVLNPTTKNVAVFFKNKISKTWLTVAFLTLIFSFIVQGWTYLGSLLNSIGFSIIALVYFSRAISCGIVFCTILRKGIYFSSWKS